VTDGSARASQIFRGAYIPGTHPFYTIAYSSSPGAELSVQPLPLIGDLNNDGKVDCSDLAIVKASFGLNLGNAEFDPRADVNGDGVINILDLSIVSRQLPAGTVCH
jgi:hypothetical protein